MNGNRVVAMTDEAAFAIDSDGTITAWNAAAQVRLGYTRSEVVGRRCWKVLRGTDLSCDRECASNCPYLESKGESVDWAQMFYRPINRTQMVLRTASNETTRTQVSTFMVGKAGKTEIVHVL